MAMSIMTLRSLLFTENGNNIKKQTRNRYEGDDHPWYCILSFNPRYKLLFQLSSIEPFTFSVYSSIRSCSDSSVDVDGACLSVSAISFSITCFETVLVIWKKQHQLY